MRKVVIRGTATVAFCKTIEMPAEEADVFITEPHDTLMCNVELREDMVEIIDYDIDDLYSDCE